MISFNINISHFNCTINYYTCIQIYIKLENNKNPFIFILYILYLNILKLENNINTYN